MLVWEVLLDFPVPDCECTSSLCHNYCSGAETGDVVGAKHMSVWHQLHGMLYYYNAIRGRVEGKQKLKQRH